MRVCLVEPPDLSPGPGERVLGERMGGGGGLVEEGDR